MNIQSVSTFDNAVKQLSAISGDVTATQLTELTELFSTQVWNTSDAEGTTASLERQIQQLQALLDETQEKMDELYNEQKYANEEMNKLVTDLNEESYQASKQADKNIKEQQDLVSKSIDEGYNAYMRGEIEKDEIPMYIANKLKSGSPAGGAAMESHLEAMDTKGQKITNLSNKISSILDDINQYTSKYKTTKASMELLEKLKAQVPDKNSRDDITSTAARPYYSPSQEALGDKLIDKYKTADEKGWDRDSQGIQNLTAGIKGSVTVDATRKAELDGMSADEKSAAVEDADTSKYSSLELMYMSGMDKTQAAYAISHIFKGAGIGYNSENGNMVVPQSTNETTKATFDNLVSQYETLWGAGGWEEGEVDPQVEEEIANDPIGWRQGDTNYMFAIDRNDDNIFNGAEEFVGAQDGWAELEQCDDDGDNTLTAEELAAHGIRVVDVNQALTGGGLYGFNGVAESGFESLDLNSYNQIGSLQSENLNGNTRVAEFDLTVNGENLVGKQTENAETYNNLFYGHVYGESYSFGLDADEVAEVLQEAAKPRNYTEAEEIENEATVANAEDIIETDEVNLEEKAVELANVTNHATDNVGVGLIDSAETDESEETEESDEASNTTTDQPEEESSTDTTVESATVASVDTTDTDDPKKKQEETI